MAEHKLPKLNIETLKNIDIKDISANRIIPVGTFLAHLSQITLF